MPFIYFALLFLLISANVITYTHYNTIKKNLQYENYLEYCYFEATTNTTKFIENTILIPFGLLMAIILIGTSWKFILGFYIIVITRYIILYFTFKG